MSENKSAWTDCVSWDDRPKTAPEGLRILADWFDAVYDEAGTNAAVQNDLRDWAKNYTDLESRVRELEAERDRLIENISTLLAQRKEAQHKSIAAMMEVAELRARHAALVEAAEKVVTTTKQHIDCDCNLCQLKSALA